MAAYYEKTKDMIGNIGALQTLVEKFPMQLISFDSSNISSSFDVLGILFKILKVDRQELIERITNELVSDGDGGENKGIIATVEELIKTSIEANIINILNCNTNPIISNDYLYESEKLGIEKQGEGICINLSEIDFNGVLKRNPCSEDGSKFYFDVSGRTVGDVYKSKDFNAYLWWVVNKGDASQVSANTWDDRYRASLWGEKDNTGEKKILICNYIDNCYPHNDSIKIHLHPDTYYKTRKVLGAKYNKTIFEFNHDFLTSIKLFEPKVVIAEMVEYLLGSGSFSVNLGVSFDDLVINEKVEQIINKVISSSDTEVDDCFFSFSNEEYNELIERAERKRHNMINTGDGFIETDPLNVLNKLTGVTDNGNIEENKTIVSDIINDITVTPAKDPQIEQNFIFNYDWQTEIMRMLVYPLIRPIFSPKILFLLQLNKKVMGSIEDYDFKNMDEKFNELLTGLWNIIKDIIVKIKDVLVDWFLGFIMDKLQPLLELFASRLLSETLKNYKSLLMQLLSIINYDWDNNGIIGNIDNVNYADIITQEQQTPESGKIC